MNMKNRIIAAVLTLATVIACAALFVGCQSQETPIDSKKPDQTSAAPNAPAEKVYDYSANLPDALFYSPKYEKLDSQENKKLNSFVNYLTMGYMSQGSSVITTGTWVYFIDTFEENGVTYHKLSYTTWDKGGSTAIYFRDETFNEIKPVLVRSALRTKISGANGGEAYLYEYNPNNVYDKNEVNVLIGSLYKECTEGYYKEQWEKYRYSDF